MRHLALLALLVGCAPADGEAVAAPPIAAVPGATIAARIAAPTGATRVPVTGYAAWIRDLPLRPPGSPVLAWNGAVVRSGEDPGLLAVVDLDVGQADLQQCADTVLRLRIEWLWRNQTADLAFHFTSGDLSSWVRWADGYRPTIHGNKVSWARTAAPDTSRANLDLWMANLFTYAGTLSLSHEGAGVPVGEVQPGDFLVDGGSPGHAVVVLDVARDPAGQTYVLIGEGYMPAQDLHILRGPSEGWYPVGEALTVATWPRPFGWDGLRRFAG